MIGRYEVVAVPTPGNFGSACCQTATMAARFDCSSIGRTAGAQ